MINVKTKRLMCYASGAMRGVYYAGVMRAMAEADVDFEEFAGISVGSTGAAWHAAGQGITGLDTWLMIAVEKLTIHPFFNNNTSKNLDWMIANDTLPRLDVEGLKKSGRTVHIGVSEIRPFLEWSKGIFRRRYLSFKGDFDTNALLTAIRASCHMPFINGIFSSTLVGGKRCLDGGLTGRIPLDATDLNRFDEIWLAAASPNAIRELNSSIPDEIKHKLHIITPSRPLPVRRIEIDKVKFLDTANIGYYDTVKAITSIYGGQKINE
jgi:predicted acylesterase/phospholipase RssA